MSGLSFLNFAAVVLGLAAVWPWRDVGALLLGGMGVRNEVGSRQTDRDAARQSLSASHDSVNKRRVQFDSRRV